MTMMTKIADHLYKISVICIEKKGSDEGGLV